MCDFHLSCEMYYDSMQVWLLEMNCNPALHTNCEVLKEVVPRTVTETLGENVSSFNNVYLSQVQSLLVLLLWAAQQNDSSWFSDLAIEIFNKCRCGIKLLPLSSHNDFVLLHCGDTAGMSLPKQRSRTAGPLRTACSKSRSSSKRTQQAGNISGCSWMSKKCPAPSLTISSNSPGAFIHTSPPVLQPRQHLANEHATSFVSANRLVPFSGASFLSSSSATADGEVVETAQAAQFHQSKLQSNKSIPTHMTCTSQQSEVTSDLSKPEHAMPKTAIISLSSPILNDDSGMIEAGQARQLDAQSE